mmetsp:Transcript_2240/g.8596  ORF Transcript_2240/g.8596 Transcript_2240/m.8596 type:complete len:237 (-) Transcript_2240:811-1521(-)
MRNSTCTSAAMMWHVLCGNVRRACSATFSARDGLPVMMMSFRGGGNGHASLSSLSAFGRSVATRVVPPSGPTRASNWSMSCFCFALTGAVTLTSGRQYCTGKSSVSATSKTRDTTSLDITSTCQTTSFSGLSPSRSMAHAPLKHTAGIGPKPICEAYLRIVAAGRPDATHTTAPDACTRRKVSTVSSEIVESGFKRVPSMSTATRRRDEPGMSAEHLTDRADARRAGTRATHAGTA